MSPSWEEIEVQARRVVEQAIEASLRIATAESCTGGLVAGALTEIPGSSAALERGFVTYSNEAKAELLSVDPGLITDKGAVSEEVARAMATGALAVSRADLAVAVTGIAGPGGGNAEKPVGLVHFAAARKNGRIVHGRQEFGPLDRRSIRLLSVAAALHLLSELMDGDKAGPTQP